MDSKEAEASLGIQLLTDLQLVFEEEVELPSKTILERLHALPESPWADLHGKPLDQLSLAKRLRNYGVKPKTIRVAAGTLRGYSKSDLEDQWRRYLPPPSEKAETSKTAETIPGQAVAGVAGVLAFPAMGRESSRCEHCHQPGDVVECHYGEASSWLHRECLDAWRTAYDRRTSDGLDIPAFLDRRNASRDETL